MGKEMAEIWCQHYKGFEDLAYAIGPKSSQTAGEAFDRWTKSLIETNKLGVHPSQVDAQMLGLVWKGWEFYEKDDVQPMHQDARGRDVNLLLIYVTLQNHEEGSMIASVKDSPTKPFDEKEHYVLTGVQGKGILIRNQQIFHAKPHKIRKNKGGKIRRVLFRMTWGKRENRFGKAIYYQPEGKSTPLSIEKLPLHKDHPFEAPALVWKNGGFSYP